jgi:uncharacterized membrane protein YagU involved in acid resistance
VPRLPVNQALTKHYGICLVIAGVFILSANQLPLLRRNAIPSGLLYGVATYVVMDFLVTPLSAAPKADIMPSAIIEAIIGHALAIGLSLAIVIRRNANADK